MNFLTYKKEEARLNDVIIYKNLQEKCAAQFQHLVDTASTLFSAPIVYISLIDEFTQVIMAKKGVVLHEMRKEDTFCHHVITKGAPLIINNTQKNGLAKSNLLVAYYPHIRFYAGAPFTSKNGHVLGAFCICDTKFRHFSETDERQLVAFSKMATEIIETNLTAEKLQNNYSDVPETNSGFSELDNNPLFYMDKKNCRIRNTREQNSHQPAYPVLTNQSGEYHSDIFFSEHQNACPIPGNQKSKMTQWWEIILDSHKRKVSGIQFSELAKNTYHQIETDLKQNGNKMEWSITEPVDWVGDETALVFLCNSLLQHISNRNKNSTIRINTFNDEDYAIMTISHEGIPLVRSELDCAFKSSPYKLDTKNKEDLYFIWHTLKLMSGFITVPQSDKERNYITIGFPKKQLHKYYA
jgi:hypothetical protein